MDVSPDVIATAIALFGVAAMILAGTWRMFVHHEKRTDARFDQVDARIDRVEDRLGSVERELTEVKISIARLEGPRPRLQVPHTR